MGTNVQDTVERIFYRVAKDLSESKTKLRRFEIESMLPSAMNRLGDKVADSADWVILQKDFVVPVSNGFGALSTNVIPRSVMPPRTRVTVPGYTYSAQWLPCIEDLEMGGRPTDFVYYTVRGDSTAGGPGGGALHIYTGDGIGLAPSPAGATMVIVKANFFPSIGVAGGFIDFPTQLQDDLESILISMCQEKMGALDQEVPGTPIGMMNGGNNG